MSGSEAIILILENGTWYGIAADYNGDAIFLLDFGDSMGNDAVMSSITLPMTVVLNQPSALKIVREAGNVHLLVVNRATNVLNRIDFGNSITNAPMSGEDFILTGGSATRTLSLVKSCDEWFGYVGSHGTGVIQKLSFGNSITSTPTIESLSLTGDALDRASRIVVHRDGQNYYAIVGSTGALLYTVDLGTDLGLLGGVVTNLGNLSVLTDVQGLEVVKDSSVYYAFGIGVNKNFWGATFDKACQVTVASSSEVEPAGVFYSESGSFEVALTVFDADSNVDHTTEMLTVNMSTAPTISISTNENRCINTDVIFTAIGTATSWTWDFDDGSPTEMGQMVTHQYATAGTFDVQLAVSDGTCENFTSQEIIIYDLPIASYTLPPGTLCSFDPIQFTNTSTGETGPVVQWDWDFNGEGSSTEKDPAFTFLTGGDKLITMVATIPGCADTTQANINIKVGPLVDFEWQNTCFNEVTEFINNTTGTGITGYEWDFGNGVTSTLENPTILYSAVGDYDVSLTVTNNLGCETELIQTITIHSLPQVSFDSDLACTGLSVQFNDQSTVTGANIDGWLWDFGDPALIENDQFSNEQNPVQIFNEAGDYDIKLIATSSFGCEDSVTQSITVLPSPAVDFSYTGGCIDESVQFQDLSIPDPQAGIDSWLWDIDGQFFTEQNPEFVFDSAGIYEVSLTINASNLCVVSTAQNVEIFDPPTAKFTFSNPCVNQFITFTDNSKSDDEVIAWEWDFDGIAQAFSEEVEFKFPQSGEYQVSLIVTTQSGCVDTVSQSIEVFDFPISSFIASPTTGGSPLLVEFTNTSSGAINYLWQFDDSGQSSDLENPSFTYTEIGKQMVTLVTTNSEDCSDTSFFNIEVVLPQVDLAIEQLNTIINENKIQLVLTITNNGTVVIDSMDVAIDVENQVSLSELLISPLAPNETINYPLNFEISEILTSN